MSTGRPAKCTGRIARVRGVIAASTWSRSRLRESSPTSTNTGWAPIRTMTLAVATKLNAGVITSSPEPIPQASSAISSPAVAEVWVRTGRPPKYCDSAASNSATFGPLASQPERSTSATPRMVSSSISGRVNGSILFIAIYCLFQERATSTTPITMTPIPATRCTLGTSPSSHHASPMLSTYPMDRSG